MDWSKRDVLIVNVPDEVESTVRIDATSGAVKGDEISEDHLPTHYVALYKLGVGIEWVGTVLFTQRDAADNYVFTVAKWRQLPQRIATGGYGVASVAYTNMFLLENSTSFSELYLWSETEYRFYAELKRRVKDVDYKSNEMSRFEFEGQKVVFEAGEIRLMDGKKNPMAIQVREFERRPNVEFRRMMGDLGKVKCQSSEILIHYE